MIDRHASRAIADRLSRGGLTVSVHPQQITRALMADYDIGCGPIDQPC
jgi:hypothetical protein